MTGSGRLTTHVLDTASGAPAAGLRIGLFAVDGSARREISAQVTNRDGRTDAPMLEGADFATGCYELVFHVGEYFRSLSAITDFVPFLDEVPVRFGVSDASAHYHVPLLVAPYGYSTYRGS
ncbi:MAG: hydroxyisourate hydrolase [Paracoccaceae bacterium]